jgi:transposase-like protein
VKLSARLRLWQPLRSAFVGFRFPTEVIVVAVRWYLRYGLSYRDVEELLVERGVEVDHVTVYRWVQRFTPLLADAARFRRHSPGDQWFVDETYVKVNGVWRYVYRAIDQYGQVIDVLVSARRDADAARRFFRQALSALKVTPTEVVTDAAAVYPAVLDELVPSAWHHVEQYANNPIEADHGRLKHRLRPMRGLRTDRTAQTVIADTPSCRTFAAATTNSPSTPRRQRGSPLRLPNSPRRSDLGQNFNTSADQTMQQSLLIAGERHLATVLAEYTRHYNSHRPQRSLGQQPPNPEPHIIDPNAARVHQRPILGGLINEYSQAA